MPKVAHKGLPITNKYPQRKIIIQIGDLEYFLRNYELLTYSQVSYITI